MTVEINWRKVPKQALVDALRNTSLGPSNLSGQDKPDLVNIAKTALRSEKAETFRAELSREVSFRTGAKPA